MVTREFYAVVDLDVQKLRLNMSTMVSTYASVEGDGEKRKDGPHKYRIIG